MSKYVRKNRIEEWNNVDVKPQKFYLCHLKRRNKDRIIAGWWDGIHWKGYRLKDYDEVIQWKKYREES